MLKTVGDDLCVLRGLTNVTAALRRTRHTHQHTTVNACGSTAKTRTHVVTGDSYNVSAV